MVNFTLPFLSLLVQVRVGKFGGALAETLISRL